MQLISRLDSPITQALRAYIDSTIRRKVKHLVSEAKQKSEQYFEKAMDTLLEESSGRLYDLIQGAGSGLRDQADDCMVEIKDTTTEGLEELKEETQEQTEAMDDYSTERVS
ncbi:hypothetical protein N7539_008586 [Penicillium diatomitis]|uniref:Uncharacterized protein n=1 Tax=Penicillium diatomitis TaxID=2819901 RepID=A0A9W9WQV4_9EURO|nr:uncharacterized protein N7539_008586 [Penicillium diatomitis]KAJ5472017.1 hypothetical protein N7539_008586 [Penicillium diatomitis]